MLSQPYYYLYQKRLSVTLLKPPIARITNPALLTPGIRTMFDDSVFPCFIAVFDGHLHAALRGKILDYEKDKSLC